MKKTSNKNISLSPHSNSEHPLIVLIGQPNCGKSTLFNHVAGYRSISTNFPGTTVGFTESHIRIDSETFDLVDVPGIYSLNAGDRAAEEAITYLMHHQVALIINVVDASLLCRSLELTLQLLEYQRPMLLCLNMIDEARRKGIHIDAEKISSRLNLTAIATIANKGIGIDELFKKALSIIHTGHPSVRVTLTRPVENAVTAISQEVAPFIIVPNLSPRLAAIKLLEGDTYFLQFLSPLDHPIQKIIATERNKLSEAYGRPVDQVIAAEYHAASLQVFEQVSVISTPEKSWRNRIDNYLTHPFWGLIFMVLILLSFFFMVFKLGAYLEEPILNLFSLKPALLNNAFAGHALVSHVGKGILQGIGGGLAVMIPYLFPFLMGMAFLEDVGYLPRIAYLLDGYMHRLGLHGAALIPAVLGYSCSVPAIMATRILSGERDRFIASVMAILVPCSARMMIILGLVGLYLGGVAAFSIYFLNIIVISLVGAFLARRIPEVFPGMIMEIPPYQWPQIKNMLAKTWLRMKDFVLFAWPILIVGSIFLSIISFYRVDEVINAMLSPISALLGLPSVVGMTLIFGVLRKELSLIMLMQALGTTDVLSVLSPVQIYVFTLFIVFYFPCLGTFGVMGKELGWKRAGIAAAIAFSLALLIGTLARFIVPVFY